MKNEILLTFYLFIVLGTIILYCCQILLTTLSNNSTSQQRTLLVQIFMTFWLILVHCIRISTTFWYNITTLLCDITTLRTIMYDITLLSIVLCNPVKFYTMLIFSLLHFFRALFRAVFALPSHCSGLPARILAQASSGQFHRSILQNHIESAPLYYG